MDALTALKGIYFFDHLTPEEGVALAGILNLVRFVPGDEILRQGQITNHFFIVDEGHVNLRHTDKAGFEKPVGSKGPGEYFGIKMFTTQEAAEFTFEAVNAAHVWVMDRKDWDKLLNTNPHIWDNMPELRAEYAKLTRGANWLAPGEIISIQTRRHWWAFFLMVRLPALLALVFTIAFFVSTTFGVVQKLPWIVLVYVGSLVVSALWAAYAGVDWFNDTYVVTNKRAVRRNRVLFVSDSQEEIVMDKIQSQKVERGGPISVFLNIATLRLSSAAEEGGVVFEEVGNVQQIQKAIDSEKIKVSERRGAAEREKLRSQISNEIRHYVFEQPTPQEKPKAQPKPLTLGNRFQNVWNWAFGTEIREKNTVTWRKHPIILFRQIAAYLGIFTLLLALTIAFTIFGSALQLLRNGVYIGLGAVMLVLFGLIVWEWLDWQVDLYRLTESQIIDIESLPFGLRYNENKADLSKIQDVNYARPQFLNTLLDYGNVISRVAGNAEPFTFDDVARPRIVADEISERIVAIKVREAERATREQTRTIVDAIVAYHRLMMTERHRDAPPPSAVTVSVPPVSELAEPEPVSVPQLEPTVSTPTVSEEEFPPEAELKNL